MKTSRSVSYVLFVLSLLLLSSGSLEANNIRIIGIPTIAKANDSIAAITFNIAWDNSWKSSKPANWDAAWIYVKCWDGDQWNHVYLQDTGHTPGKTTSSDPTYRVENRDKSLTKMPMVIKPGYSMVWKKWHIDPTEDSVKGVAGVFLYRKDSLGAGDVLVPFVSLLWNYKNQGFVEDDDLVVKVFAIEMVYVPEGAYYLGGKGTAVYQPNAFTTNNAVFGTPMYVTSEDSIVIANDANPKHLWMTGSAVAGGLSKAFPKGYQAFYIMKYELTQEAYADFLNTLNQGQQDARIQATLAGIGVGGSIWNGSAGGMAHYRHHIEVSQRAPSVSFGVDATNNNKWNETIQVLNRSGDTCSLSIDGQDLAVNSVSMYDLLAYADFAGLRPMTELEYEKACRGTRPVVNDEYAWGSTTKTYANKPFNATDASWFTWNTTAIPNINRGDEQMLAEYNCGATHGIDTRSWWYFGYYHYSAPIRVGCFADSTSNRAAAGATYWGVMNMSDNVSELCISVGYWVSTNTGRKFQGAHGDGQINSQGNADVTDWTITTVADYYIPRGMIFPTASGPFAGDNVNNVYGEDLNAGMVSARHLAAHGLLGDNRSTHHAYMSGIRCVRTETTNK